MLSGGVARFKTASACNSPMSFPCSTRESFAVQMLITCSRSLNRVQNRAITRYALFVVWKLYTCRCATQQTEHFSFRNSSIYNQRLISEKCLFLREQKQTACTHFSSLAPLYTRTKQAAPSVIPVLDTGISSSRVGSFTVKALSGELNSYHKSTVKKYPKKDEGKK